LRGELKSIQKDFADAVTDVPGLSRTLVDFRNMALTNIYIQKPKIKDMDSVKEELFVQLTLEDRWEKLVSTIAIEAGDQSQVFELLELVIEQAAFEILDSPLRDREFVPLPPQFEQSLQRIARK
jgi:hypothetical protein